MCVQSIKKSFSCSQPISNITLHNCNMSEDTICWHEAFIAVVLTYHLFLDVKNSPEYILEVSKTHVDCYS